MLDGKYHLHNVKSMFSYILKIMFTDDAAQIIHNANGLRSFILSFRFNTTLQHFCYKRFLAIKQFFIAGFK